MTPSATQSEKQAMGQANANQASAATNQSTVANNNSQLNGPVQDTGYYQNQVKSGTGATTEGYDASKRNLKQAMESAGVSGSSGVSAGNETALGAQEAHDLAQVKTNAYADTEKQQLAANAEDLTAAGQEDSTGLGYAGINNEDAVDRQHQGWKNTAALTQAILSAGMGA